VIARADEAVQRVPAKREARLYASAMLLMTAGVMPPLWKNFNRPLRVCVSSWPIFRPGNQRTGQRRTTRLVISPGISVTKGIPGFQWTELRRLQPVLVMPEAHLLAKLKRIPPVAIGVSSPIGLAKGNYPEYVPHVRGMLSR